MGTLNPIINLRAIFTLFAVLCKQRELTFEMTKREFSERYAGQIFGMAWGVAHPVVVILVYIFVFSFVFQSRVEVVDDAASDYTIYLLAGLVPWMALAEVMGKGTLVIKSNANLVKQVIFPLEVLPTKTVIATFVNELILLVGVMVYHVARHWSFSWTFGLLPLLLVIQFMQMLGLAMILATVGAYLRDLKDMVQVFCLVNVYLTPVLFLPGWLPGRVQWLLYLNPFTYQALCFQDVFYYGRIAHPWAWLLYIVLSFLAIGIGYRFFSKLRIYFGNVL